MGCIKVMSINQSDIDKVQIQMKLNLARSVQNNPVLPKMHLGFKVGGSFQKVLCADKVGFFRISIPCKTLAVADGSYYITPTG